MSFKPLLSWIRTTDEAINDRYNDVIGRHHGEDIDLILICFLTIFIMMAVVIASLAMLAGMIPLFMIPIILPSVIIAGWNDAHAIEVAFHHLAQL